jgi:hypothetical protein
MGMSLMGKIFFASAGAYIAGDLISAFADKKIQKFNGSDAQLERAVDILMATPAFQKALKKCDGNLKKAIVSLGLQSMDPSTFEKVTGRRFPR